MQKDISLSDELACISFYYHMFGADMGTLSVDVIIGSTWYTIWSRTGEQHTWANTGYGGTKQFLLDSFEGVAVYLSDFDGIINTPAIDKSQIISVRFLYTATAGVAGDCPIDCLGLSHNPIG